MNMSDLDIFFGLIDDVNMLLAERGIAFRFRPALNQNYKGDDLKQECDILRKFMAELNG